MPFENSSAIRLDLDITGINISNRIIDEPHTLSNRPSRSIAPKLGPFFANSLIVKDGSSTLERGRDYQIVELHQEATLLYGKEISSVILIINSNVSSNPTITYQALGGHYAHSDEPIARLYESVINDNRPVDWSNVLNKPTEFNPTIHRHLLDDVFGFEPVVDQLERIKRAITLGQVSIVMEILNNLLARFKCKELPAILPNSKLIRYDALLYFLTKRKIISNVSIDLKDCNLVKGNSYVIQVDTTTYPIGETLYWEFYSPDGLVSSFARKNGTILTKGELQEFNIYIPTEPYVVNDNLYIGLKKHPDDKEYLAVSYLIEIQEYKSTTSGEAYLYNRSYSGDGFDHMNRIYGDNDEYRLWRVMSDV